MIYTTFVALCVFVLRGEALRGLQTWLVTYVAWVTARWMMIMCGLFYIRVEHIDDFDYSKWLGPNWKDELKDLSPSTIIANHVCWMDIIILFA